MLQIELVDNYPENVGEFPVIIKGNKRELDWLIEGLSLAYRKGYAHNTEHDITILRIEDEQRASI
jgi:hypothetical protein